MLPEGRCRDRRTARADATSQSRVAQHSDRDDGYTLENPFSSRYQAMLSLVAQGMLPNCACHALMHKYARGPHQVLLWIQARQLWLSANRSVHTSRHALPAVLETDVPCSLARLHLTRPAVAYRPVKTGLDKHTPSSVFCRDRLGCRIFKPFSPTAKENQSCLVLLWSRNSCRSTFLDTGLNNPGSSTRTTTISSELSSRQSRLRPFRRPRLEGCRGCTDTRGKHSK